MKTTDHADTPIANTISEIARNRTESLVNALPPLGWADVPTAARSFDSEAFAARKRAFWSAHQTAIAAARNHSVCARYHAVNCRCSQ